MEIIQLAIADSSYAAALRDQLVRNAVWKVLTVDLPDPTQDGVIVLDSQSLELLPVRIPKPERVVLVTQNDPQHLARAWDAGIVSVVFEHDPVSTAMLAIMAARLKVTKPAADAVASGAGEPRGRLQEKRSS